MKVCDVSEIGGTGQGLINSHPSEFFPDGINNGDAGITRANRVLRGSSACNYCAGVPTIFNPPKKWPSTYVLVIVSNCVEPRHFRPRKG